MDLSKQFSLTDILAFFFPGLFSMIGIYLLLLLTPLKPSLNSISSNLTTGLIFLAQSYIMGILISGISLSLVEWIEKIQKHKNARETIPLIELHDDILEAFKSVFGMRKNNVTRQWSKACFYLCRSIILEKMPTVGQKVERQSSLRQLRANLILPIFIWLMVGICWGIQVINDGSSDWGAILIISSVLVGIISFQVTVFRMYKNEELEVREVLTGFLAGYNAGIFNKSKPK